VAALTEAPPAPEASTGSGGTITPAPYVPPSPGAITAAGAIRNDGGTHLRRWADRASSANINNNGGTLSVASMSVNQPTFSNQGGTLNVSNGFTRTSITSTTPVAASSMRAA
jgi:filamentous hemagglutinin